MSFVFPSWSTAFSPAFHEDAKGMLEAALNKGNKPPVIQGRIEVVELSMGTQPPTLTLLEIGDLSLDRFRGILKLGYQGDAWLEVRCRVQANPLSHNPNLLPSSTLPLSTPLLASQPLLVPMTLRLSLLHLRAILILVVSASKGITLVFKNDPLQNVDVSSTFDSVEVIRGYLQQEIEGQLREMFREDLPGIIHRLSQRWFTGTGVAGKVETPYKDGEYASSTTGGTPGRPDDDENDIDPNDPQAERDIFPPYVPSQSVNLTPRRRALQKAMRSRRLSTAASDSPTSYTVFPDIEDYDPTYGLRPEGLPTHSGYEAFGRLWEKAREGETRGLGGLMDSSLSSMGRNDRGDVSDSDWDEDDCDSRSFDMVEMDEALQVTGGVYGGGGLGQMSRRPSGRGRADTIDSSSRYGEEEQVEWETFPAVGGGLITRPRVYHSQSRIRAPSDAGGAAMPSPGATATAGSVTARASSVGGSSSTVGSLRKIPFSPLPTPGLNAFRAQAGPGPSSLRRLATSRSDVFLTGLKSRSDSFSSQIPTSPSPLLKTPNSFRHSLSRPMSTAGTGTGTGSSAARTSGSSWDKETYESQRNGSRTTPESSNHLTRSMSMDIKSPRKGNGQGGHHRTPSFATTTGGISFPPRNVGPGGFTLPINNSVSQLATLSHSNQTLSPYARGHEHIAVRSFPHLGRTNTATGGLQYPTTTRSNNPPEEGLRMKATRKRIHRLNPKKEEPVAVYREGSQTPPTEYDDSQSRRLSSSSEGAGYGSRAGWQTPSLVGAAQRVMRPNFARGDSRTSYGFPPVSGFGRIPE